VSRTAFKSSRTALLSFSNYYATKGVTEPAYLPKASSPSGSDANGYHYTDPVVSITGISTGLGTSYEFIKFNDSHIQNEFLDTTDYFYLDNVGAFLIDGNIIEGSQVVNVFHLDGNTSMGTINNNALFSAWTNVLLQGSSVSQVFFGPGNTSNGVPL